MAANPNITPRVELVFEKKTVPACEPGRIGLKQRVRALLIEIFKGYEEFLGWTPD